MTKAPCRAVAPSPRRVLVTGFGAFPGAPANPTASLVAALRQVRRPALAGIAVKAQVLPVTWSGATARLERLRETWKPDAVLLFGLAGSARRLRVERRAANVAGRLRTDAEGRSMSRPALEPGGPPVRLARADLPRLVAALRGCGSAAELSSNAGTYLCNAILWSALAQTDDATAVAFIHVPRLARAVPRSRLKHRALRQPALLRAAVAAILALRLPSR